MAEIVRDRIHFPSLARPANNLVLAQEPGLRSKTRQWPPQSWPSTRPRSVKRRPLDGASGGIPQRNKHEGGQRRVSLPPHRARRGGLVIRKRIIPYTRICVNTQLCSFIFLQVGNRGAVAVLRDLAPLLGEQPTQPDAPAYAVPACPASPSVLIV
jgi:hypothetical protein